MKFSMILLALSLSLSFSSFADCNGSYRAVSAQGIGMCASEANVIDVTVQGHGKARLLNSKFSAGDTISLGQLFSEELLGADFSYSGQGRRNDVEMTGKLGKKSSELAMVNENYKIKTSCNSGSFSMSVKITGQNAANVTCSYAKN